MSTAAQFAANQASARQSTGQSPNKAECRSYSGATAISLAKSQKVITIVITNWSRAMVELKVRKFGNSLGVVLPKEVINRLHAADGEALFLIEAPDGGYQLTPYDPGFSKKMAKADDIISRYRNTLHVLAR
jgi:putative addiction module antidote